MSRDSNGEIPKIIWILWLQGFDAAPDLVKKCLLSWQRHNPDWKIICLDEKNLKEHINVDEFLGQNQKTISIQALTNIIRINLLAKFGGVWADSTCFCRQPLDKWIGNHIVSGFFAFANPGKDRLISSWFLASGKNCHLTETYCRETNAFWKENYFPHQKKWRGRMTVKWLGKILNRNARLAGLWVHPLTVRIFRLHPYHWFHYIFYRVVTRDERSGKIWDQTPKISADIPHRLQIAGFLKPATAEIKAAIDGKKDPLYKLNWRCEAVPPDSILAYLLRRD